MESRVLSAKSVEPVPVNRPNLDLMRALAVSCVLIDHTAHSLHHGIIRGWDLGWLGLFGVDLFFVHTCLVLMWSLERRPHTLDFYVRRVFRIYPLAMVTVLIVAAFHLQEFPGAIRLKQLVVNLLLVTNLTNDWLVWGVLWSLQVEVQMYLVLPLLFLFARRERTFWPLLLLWAFVCKLGMAYFGKDPAYFNGITAVPLFLPGVMAYLGYKRFRARWPALFFPVLLVAMAVWFLRAPSVPRGWIVCLCLGFALPMFREVQNRVITAVSHTVAKYSYGIYLLHPFSLLLAFHWLPLRSSVGIRLGVEALTIPVLATLAYHLIEHPLMRVGSRVANRLQQRFGTNYASEFGLDLA